MGFIHSFGDARMPIWGVLAILSNFLLALLSGSGHRGFHLASLCMLILFVVIYNRLSKPINRLQTEACKNGRKARQCSGAADVVGSIGDDPRSAARCVPARPVPGIVGHVGVNATGEPGARLHPDFMDVSVEGSSVWSAIKSSLKRRRFRGLWRRASDIVQT